MRLSTKLSLLFLPAIVTVMVGLLLVTANLLDEAVLTTHHNDLGNLVAQLRQAKLAKAEEIDRAAIARRLAELGSRPRLEPGTPEGALLLAWQEVMLRAGRDLTVLRADGAILLSTIPGGYEHEGLWRSELGGDGLTLVPGAPAPGGGLLHAPAGIRTGIAELPGQRVPYAASRYAALGWVVVVAVPRNEISATLSRLDWWILGIGGSLSILLVMAGWFMARRLILHPVEVLQGAAQDIAAFRPVGRIPVEGRDELADLARALEGMARELGTAFHALRREHDLNAVLMNSAPAAIAVLDAQGRILHCNGRFGQAFGPAAGRPIAAIVAAAEDRAQAETHFAAARAAAREFQLSGGPDSAVFAWTVAALPAAVQARRAEADGTGPTAADIAVSPQPPGPVPAFIATGIDVTERHRAEADRRALEARLEHQRRLETLGTFAGGVAHDLNNILTPVLGYARMAEDRIAGDPRSADYLARIRKSADRARHLIQQILTFGRKVGPEKEVLDLAEFVDECLDLEVEEPGARTAIRRDWKEADGAQGAAAVPLQVDADPVQLHQVLSNLVSNARHAMPDGGEIAVSVFHREADAAGENGPGWAAIQVADSGGGMDEAVLTHIFEPFYTTRRAGRGTGLGLSVVHGIVTAHGGRIEVESRPGQGSRFTVLLPLTQEAPTAGVASGATQTGDGPSAIDLSGTKVLVVDDDAAVQLLAQRVLQEAGCRVLSAGSGAAALDLLQGGQAHGTGRPVDLVLTDLVMPGMSGQELAAAVAAAWPGLPLVAMTGGPGATASAPDAAPAGAAALFAGRLAKPFDPQELLELVRKVVESGRNRA